MGGFGRDGCHTAPHPRPTSLGHVTDPRSTLTPRVSLSQTYHRHPSTTLSSSLESWDPPLLSFAAALGPGSVGSLRSRSACTILYISPRLVIAAHSGNDRVGDLTSTNRMAPLRMG